MEHAPLEQPLAVPPGDEPQEVEDRRLGEFGSAADPAMHRVELLGDRRRRRPDEVGIERTAGRRLELPQTLGQRTGAFADAIAAVAPQCGDPLQDLAKGRATPARLGREIGAAPEGLALGGEEHGERPAPLFALQG